MQISQVTRQNKTLFRTINIEKVEKVLLQMGITQKPYYQNDSKNRVHLNDVVLSGERLQEFKDLYAESDEMPEIVRGIYQGDLLTGFGLKWV